jgi:hypothetical protein
MLHSLIKKPKYTWQCKCQIIKRVNQTKSSSECVLYMVATWGNIKTVKSYESAHQIKDGLVNNLLQLIIIQVFANHHLQHLKIKKIN